MIQRIDMRAKHIPVLSYPRRWRLTRPRICTPRKQAQLDTEFRGDTGQRLRWQPSIRGLDQIDQITADAFESEEAAQNPPGCGEGRRSGSGRWEQLPMRAIADAHRAGTIEGSFQVGSHGVRNLRMAP
ncbi:MAG TPA: hypothetical protein VN630_02130 [Rhodanobacteraceae bacterium]|nr:hypothetical protein [Rhodanobacteraceae bacterium]